MKRQTWQSVSFGEGDRIARRVQFVIILVLLAALIAAAVFTIPNLGVRGRFQRDCLTVMLREANSAVSRAEKLDGGSVSNLPLAEIYSSVAVIESANSLYRGSGGEGALSDDTFAGITRQIEEIIRDAKTTVHSIDQKVYGLRDDLILLRNSINELLPDARSEAPAR